MLPVVLQIANNIMITAMAAARRLSHEFLERDVAAREDNVLILQVQLVARGAAEEVQQKGLHLKAAHSFGADCRSSGGRDAASLLKEQQLVEDASPEDLKSIVDTMFENLPSPVQTTDE